MKLYVGVTDKNWFEFLRARPELDEVNFWQPSGSRQFRVLQPGDPFLFKLHHPDNFIVGGGMFAHSSLCPIDMAWEAFAEKNGVGTLEGMRRRLAHYRRLAPDSREDFTIGCIILESPFFFPRDWWIPCPSDFAINVVQGKTYDATTGTGQRLWAEVQARLTVRALPHQVGEGRAIAGPIWGEPRLVKQRLGQGAFHMLVADTYERRCAVTREKALPVLEAAHIRPVTKHGEHRVDNGLLLRSDVHTLFDKGYLTITPEYRLRVSGRLKKDFDNGEHYYQLRDNVIWTPSQTEDKPNKQFLEWHADSVFLG
jgi:putative restriction endonuclease